jgi:hypothetical protein
MHTTIVQITVYGSLNKEATDVDECVRLKSSLAETNVPPLFAVSSMRPTKTDVGCTLLHCFFFAALHLYFTASHRCYTFVPNPIESYSLFSFFAFIANNSTTATN